MPRAARSLTLVVLIGVSRLASAQGPQSTSPAPDDTPTIRLGTTIFPDFTYTVDPTTVDSDGNSIHLSQFNLTRAFIDISGRISHRIAFRVTPDVARETSLFSNISGSLELRIYYAYAEFELGDWMPDGSWLRFGIQQTPWIDFDDRVYRYRFQGTTFAEREGYLSPADAGASFHYALPSEYGDVHVGIYNGEGFNHTEANNEKAVEVRGTVRPFAGGGDDAPLHGLRASIFYDGDNYVKNGPRNRLIGSVTFEHPSFNAGFEYLKASDRTSITKPEIDGDGFSVWATPRLSNGIEGLVRYDRLKPNTSAGSQTSARTIVGVAYWFPHQGGVASALLLDYDGQRFNNFTPAQPKQTKVAVHGLITF